ncbi:hypothetical protein [Aequorivita echinoideorum]|uniref:Uncharacterized protein n=1 Tax=Aequorivita echinoideorum TaxID=1549647 RepID=A0ABS5S7I3_9FLAO|nr:hypothetical protein [Aequorivita echinoideorum]MBT0608943.1 hypothetical protein [Aequorivita echinoideorum]
MTKPLKCISVEEATQLQDNWLATRAIYIEQGLGGADTREFLFSVEELQEFLDYVKSESEEQEIDNPGVRIYFAAYNSEENNKATVFLAPTKGTDENADNNYKIDPMNTVIGGWPPKNY